MRLLVELEHPPLCPCHGVPMYGQKNATCKSGVGWTCSIRRRYTQERWHEANRERTRENLRKWKKAHPEKVRESVRKATTPAQAAEKARRRRARKANVPTDTHTRAQVFERDGGVCQICTAELDPKNWHEDHVIPISLGGPDTLDNCQATCPGCNLRKGARVA